MRTVRLLSALDHSATLPPLDSGEIRTHAYNVHYDLNAARPSLYADLRSDNFKSMLQQFE